MLKLQFKDRRREAVWLVDHTFSIGKSPRNSLMINDQSILEFHAEIINEHDKLTLVDKSAGKGIWVNGKQVTSHMPLKKNDVLRFGQVELQLVDPKAGASLSAAKTQSKPLGGSWAIQSKASWLEKSRYDITKRVIIGRDPSCDITLALDHLSRKHAALEVKNGQLYVEDLNSSNGTFVNGERITQKGLKPGDKVKMDVVTFEVFGPESPVTDPNKTIIRTAPAQGQAGLVGTSSQNGSSSAKIKSDNNKLSSTKAPAKKKLAAEGKQDWIAGKENNEPKSRGGLIIGILLLAIGIGAAIVLI